MLRRLERATPWNCSDYVCLSCRHQLRAAQSQQRRRQSTRDPLPASAAAASVDSWEDNFNNLDVGLEPPGRSVAKSQDDAIPPNDFIFPRNSAFEKPLGPSTSKRLLVGNKTNGLDRRQERRTRARLRASSKGNDMAGLMANLEQRMPSAKADLSLRHRNVNVTFPAPSVVDDQAGDGPHAPMAGDGHASPAETAETGERMPLEVEGVFDDLKQEFTLDIASTRSATRSEKRQRTRDLRDLRKLHWETSDSRTPQAEGVRAAEEGDAVAIKDIEAISGGETTSEAASAAQYPNPASRDDATRNREPDATTAQAPTLKSVARPPWTSWLVGKLLPASRKPAAEVSQPVQEDAASMSKPAKKEVLPFGAQASTSGSTEVRAPGSVTLTVPSPNFGDGTGSHMAAAALADLHNGWKISEEDGESPSSASKSGKQTTKKPAESSKRNSKEKKEVEPVTKKNLKRRERALAKQVSAAEKKASKGKEPKTRKRESTKEAEPQSSAQQDTSERSGPSKPPKLLTIEPKKLAITPLDIPQPPVPGLEYGLDRVLFNPGVYQLQDPHSRVYNFDPYLQTVMPVVEFDYNALKEYKTSSQDMPLAEIARANSKRYIGSTSSMTGTLGHFHYLLSAFRPLNMNMLSRGFPEKLDTFTLINRAPNAIFLRWKNGTYAIDADKEHDSANVLMMLGKSMEKLLTLPTAEFERYRKSDPRSVSEEERQAPESFQYTTMGDFLMRSQLDAYDPRLPGTGMFDLKTRAVLTVRMSTDDFQPMTGYQIHTLQGKFESYEREYYDMLRSTMLKYMLQVRMGRMDGIFIAFHNVERIFGFQYVSLQDMDRALHGQIDLCLGDQEFKVSLEMLNKVFDMATAKFPEQSLRFHFEAVEEKLGKKDMTVLWVFAEPMGEEQIDRIQSSSKERVAEFEREMMGMEKEKSSDSKDGEVPASAKDESETASSTDPPKIASPKTTGKPASTPSDSSKDSSALAPLFIANILCESKVEGATVTRPENLKPSEIWKVDYIVQEWDADAAMWARYEQTKARRKELFAKFYEDDDDADAPTSKREKAKANRNKSWMELMKSMSMRGREFRNKADKLEEGKTPVVLGQPIESLAEVERMEGVQDYMSWLYGKR